MWSGAFMFTDIQGSTELWDKQPKAMQAALERHDAVLRSAIEGHSGVVFKTIGDAFCAAFPTATDAGAAAMEIQTRLLGESFEGVGAIRVRVGIHFGEAQYRDQDYFGPALNRVARLMSAASGGQVLVSSSAYEEMLECLPEGAVLQELGEVRLKGIQRVERVYQLVGAGLPSHFPALRSLEATPNNLPQLLTSFVGREAELERIRALVEKSPLVTLVGAGGTGKTRLGLRAASTLLDEMPDGIFLIELAPITEPSLIINAIGSALGVAEEPSRPMVDTVLDFLRDRRVMLLLDNCEHVLAATANLLHRLLRSCPGLRVVATSREAFGVPGEQLFRVQPMSLPDIRRLPTTGELASLESVALFVERARFVKPEFELTDSNAMAVARICRRLDGIPLAIELAAARLKSLSPEQILERLNDRFRLLTGGSRTSLPHQQTLRAAMDWSYDLLKDSERALLRRISVFAGTWSLEATEGVCSGGEIDEYEVLDLLSQLVDKSLVNLEDGVAGESRYRLLLTVREYGLVHLLEAGEAQEFRDRHRDLFLELAERAEPELQSRSQATWLDRLETEHDNLRAALEWSIESGVESGLRMAGALWRFWSLRGYLSEARDWLAKALRTSAGGSYPEAEAKALRAAGVLALNQDDHTNARLFLEQSLDLCRLLADKKGEAAALNSLGNVAWRRGELASAYEYYEQSLALERGLGNELGTARGLISLGNVALLRGQCDDARSLYNEALGLARQLENKSWEASILHNLGDVAAGFGRFDEAHALLEQSIEARKAIGDKLGVARANCAIGEILCLQGRPAEGKELLDSALAMLRELGDRHWVAAALLGLSDVTFQEGDFKKARRTVVLSAMMRNDVSDRVGIAQCLGKLSSISEAMGHGRIAARILGAEMAVREQIGSPRTQVEEKILGDLENRLLADIGEPAYHAQTGAGKALSLAQVLGYFQADRDAVAELNT